MTGTGSTHEFALIEWIRARAAQHPRVALGIGDDAAVVRFPAPADCVVATDMLMDGVHFEIASAGPQQIGWKSLAVNLSDLAAMACQPLAAFISIALPRSLGESFARDLHAGLQALADQFGVALAGGDTNIWKGPLVTSVTVLGEVPLGGAICRSGARPGDWIFTTGSLGGSLGGHHLQFLPRVREALTLRKAGELHAMIDISDGVASDLGHILAESQVGAIVQAEAVPISQAARMASDGRSPLEHALCDGEDFELLFTVAPDVGRQFVAAAPLSIPVTRIGEIVAEKVCLIEDSAGNRSPLAPGGWQHRF